MNFEAKRVPLDFCWEVNEPWPGYVNRFYASSIPCPHCLDFPRFSSTMRHLRDRWTGAAPFRPEERGRTPYLENDKVVVATARRLLDSGKAPEHQSTTSLARKLRDELNTQWRYHLCEQDVTALLQHGTLMPFTHTLEYRKDPEPKNPPYIPTANEVNNNTVLGNHFDQASMEAVFRAECQRRGEPVHCSACKGDARLWPDDGTRNAAAMWMRSDPPQGDGYQMWDSSDDSPISPVFANEIDLAEWMFHSFRPKRELTRSISLENWLSLIRMKGPVPQFIFEMAISG